MDRIPSNTLSVREAKNRLGNLNEMARQEPVSITKYGRPVVEVMSVGHYERVAVAYQIAKNKKS